MQDETEANPHEPRVMEYIGGPMRPVDDFDLLRRYLVWRIEDHVASGGTAREIAEKTGLSEGFISNVRKGTGRLGMRGIPEICAFFNLSLSEAQELAAEHAKKMAAAAQSSRPARRAESRNLARAIELLREDGIAVSPAIRDTMLDFLEIEGDLRVDLWVQHMRTARLIEQTGRLAQVVKDGQDANAKTQGHRREPTSPTPLSIRRADKSAK